LNFGERKRPGDWATIQPAKLNGSPAVVVNKGRHSGHQVLFMTSGWSPSTPFRRNQASPRPPTDAGDDRSSNAEKRGCGDGGDRETRFFKHRDAIFESGGGSDWGFKSDDRRAGNASRMPPIPTAVEALLILTSCSREV